jgi:hypothetical protein
MLHLRTNILIVCALTFGSQALAQPAPQDPVSKAAVEVQQEAAQGAISQKEAGKITGQLWKLKSEQDQDISRNGGYLTPGDKHTLWAEIHSIRGGANFNGQNWNNGTRNEGAVDRFGNNYPRGPVNYAYGAQPGGYPSGPGQNNYEYAPANNPYGASNPNSGYRGEYQNEAYQSNGPNYGYNNGGLNTGGNSNSGGSKLSQAASFLQNLMHH